MLQKYWYTVTQNYLSKPFIHLIVCFSLITCVCLFKVNTIWTKISIEINVWFNIVQSKIKDWQFLDFCVFFEKYILVTYKRKHCRDYLLVGKNDMKFYATGNAVPILWSQSLWIWLSNYHSHLLLRIFLSRFEDKLEWHYVYREKYEQKIACNIIQEFV